MTQKFDKHATNPDLESDVPDAMRQVLHDLHTKIMKTTTPKQAGERNSVSDIHTIYEYRLHDVIEQHYSTKPVRGQPFQFHSLPKQMYVAECFDNNPNSSLVYQVIYYRHMFTSKVVQTEVRESSWEMFKEVLSHFSVAQAVDLPNSFLWDVLDEFIYQLGFHHRSKLPAGESFKDSTAWTVKASVELLTKLVERTGIVKVLDQVRNGNTKPYQILVPNGNQHVIRAMGFFGLVALMRINVLVGDYHGALESIAPLGVHTFASSVTANSSVPACHTALFYNVGFAYMMLRRYTDARKMLTTSLATQRAPSPAQKYLIALQNQVCSLLAVIATLSSRKLDDNVFSVVKDKERLHEELHSLGMGDVDSYRDVFQKACPKFLSFSETDTTGLEGTQLQTNVFMRDVQQQLAVASVSSYLCLYSSLNTKKLESLISEQQVKDAKIHLMCMKHKSRQLVSSTDDGKPAYRDDRAVQFYVNGENISVVAGQQKKSVTDRFIERITAINAKSMSN